MEPKFKVGDSVKLKDDVVNWKIYNNIELCDDYAKLSTKYTVAAVDKDSYVLKETDCWVGEDALELWSEPVSEIKFEPKTDGILEQLNTVGEQAKSEIDPQLFELVKVFGPVVYQSHMNESKSGVKITPNGIASDTVGLAKETLRLLREEKNK